MRVAVLGTGIMGAPIARNLAAAGHEVRAWNRSADKAQALAGDGVEPAGDIAEAVRGADVVMTMLADATAVEAVAGEALAAMDGAVLVQLSTIGPEATARVAEQAKAAGVPFVDAPVLGTKKPADEGKLVVLASGDYDKLEPIFDAIGQRTVECGDAGKGTRLKLAINTWLVALVEGAAETIALAEGIGIDPQLVLDALSGTPTDLPYLQMKGAMMIKREFEPSFKLSLAAKDARLALTAAEEAGLDLPMLATIADRLDDASDDHGDEDMAATFRLSAPQQQPAAR